jgi:protein TonB
MISDPVRLKWLRPVAIAVVVGVHAGAAVYLALPSPPKIAAADSLDLTIAQGQPEPPAPEPPPPEPPPPEPPPPEPPKPEPPPPPPVPPPPAPPPPVAPPAPKREVASAPAFAQPKVQPKPPEPPPPNAPPPDPNAPGEQEARDKKTAALQSYGQKVNAEINRHKRSQRRTGNVRIHFIINAAGEVTQANIVSASGKEELDEVALDMVRDARPGPPPDGIFDATITINFTVDK